jgi:hypothetical protein
MAAKYPNVKVPLVGEDGDAFAIIGRVKTALCREVGHEAGAEYVSAAYASESYDALLRLTVDTVTVMF